MPIEYILLGVGDRAFGNRSSDAGVWLFWRYGSDLAAGRLIFICWAAALRPRIFCLVLYWHWAQ